MINRGHILIADLLEAFVGLRVDDDATRAEIASLLGLRTRQLPTPVAKREEARAPATVAREVSPETMEEGAAEGALQVVPSTLEFVRSETSLRATEAPAPPRVPPLERPAAEPVPPAAPESLLVPRWARGIVSASLATREEGPLDVEAAVEVLARAEPLTHVPTLPRPTLRNGAQVLLDRSGAMVPFYADQAVFVREIADAVGEHRIRVLRFNGCPTRGAGTGSPGTWSRYRPPRRGTPVVVVTDLGAGRPPLAGRASEPSEWRTFVSDARAAGCPTVAFVPYPPDRLPANLPRELKIVRWDRGTTARDARHAVRGPLEVVA